MTEPINSGKSNATGASGDQKAQDGLKEALIAERHNRQGLETKVSELTGQVQALLTQAQQPKQAAPEAKVLSEADLRDGVVTGRLTEDEAAQIRRNQDRKQIKAEVTSELINERNTQTIADKVTADIAIYKELIPDINDTSSTTFLKVKREYDFLIGLGSPADTMTELQAVRSAFGDIDTLKKVDSQGRRETHRETGGGQMINMDDSVIRSDGAPKWLPTAQRVHYQRMIEQGMYNGWDDPNVKTELETYGDRWKG